MQAQNFHTLLQTPFMPESRNRPGHPYQAPADIPSSQRVKGRIMWAILFAVFASLIAFFSVGENYLVLALVAAGAALLGFVIGKAMEKDASHKG